MLKLVILVIFFFTSLSHAQSILVQAPGTSHQGFAEALAKPPSQMSYVAWLLKSLQNNPGQEQKAFSLGEAFLTQEDLTLMHLKGLQASAPWTLMTLRFVRDLSERALETSTNARKKEMQALNCRTNVLLSDGIIPSFCKVQYVDLSLLQKRFPRAESLAIESLGYSLAESNSVAIAAQTNYHWTLLSNSTSPVHFYGTYEQFLQQTFDFTDIVNGGCDEFTTGFDNFAEITRTLIYFSPSCQRSAAAPLTKKSFFAENKSWIIATGLVVLGGIAYSLKDKQVSITLPGLK